MTYPTLEGISLAGKRVVVRADLNVPIENGKISDATRLTRFAPTVKALRDKGASVIVLSHFDRPKGKVVPQMSLQPVAAALGKAIGHDVQFVATDWSDGDALNAAQNAKAGDVLLMENTRFHPGEEANDEAFARQLAALGDLYVNDAFSAAHRAHASTAAITNYIPSYIGPGMQAELKALSNVLDTPQHPVLAIIGGAKVSSKLDLIGNLIGKVQRIAIGGAMANTFLAAEGHDLGQKSLVERDMFDTARGILNKAKDENCELILPLDFVAADAFEANAPHAVYNLSTLDKTRMILDIGPATITMMEKTLADSRTLLWNGPFGAFEHAPFDKGTTVLAKAAARLTQSCAMVSVAGGGDTVAALNKAGVADDFTYVSTAGGAFLEWLEGKTLPGLAALQNNITRKAS